ncbi:hypothetical protein PoB_003799200, partial [Plakobranchus ocellatus]
PVHNKVISDVQARAPVAGLEHMTEGSLQISGQICYPLYHRYSSEAWKDEKGTMEDIKWMSEGRKRTKFFVSLHLENSRPKGNTVKRLVHVCMWKS